MISSSLHRVITKTDNRPPSISTNSLHYNYDAVGNILSKTDYQNAVTSYRYDNANRLVGMQNPDYVAVSYHYDPAGRLLTRILSNGTTTAYTYDNGNRLMSLTTEHAGGSVVGEESYTRDRVGNLTTVTTPIGATTYTYDALYRLTEGDYPNTEDDYRYSYDKVGNRLTRTIGVDTLAYAYNEGNRLTAIRIGSESGELANNFDYDDAGNLIAKRDGFGSLLESYSWGPKGHMTGVSNRKGTFAYAYDPFDYRISKAGPGVSVGYLLEGEHVEAMTGSHQPAQFFRGVVVDEIVNGYQYDPNGDWTNYTYAHDSLQSVVGLTGHEGRTIQTTAYAPFGGERETAGASCSVLRYTGREQDAETGLYYYRARYFDPELGRFITEDPIRLQGGINYYVYVNNNPINFNDPEGLCRRPQGGGYCLNAFIPQEELYGGLVRGDNRGPNPEGGTFRVQQLLPNGAQIGTSEAGISHAFGFDVPGIIDPEGTRVTRRSDGGVRFVGEAGIGHGLGIPADLEFEISIGRIPGGGHSVSGRRDRFPSFEVWNYLPDNVQGPPELIYHFDASIAGTGPFTGLPRPMEPIGSRSGAEFGTGAFGGFLLYPNKPNTNRMQQVYSK